MTFDFDSINASKRAMRSHLAALPIGEKLRMLDALRERTLAIRRSRETIRPPQPPSSLTSDRGEGAGG